MNDHRKKKARWAAVSICLILGFGILLFPYHFSSLLKECFLGDDYKLQLFYLNDTLKEEDKYVVTGADAYVTFDAGEEFSLLNGKIYLSSAVEKDTKIQMFYAVDDHCFREENSYYAVIEKGRDFFVFSLPREKVRYVRIDIEEDIGYSLRISRVTAAADKWTAYIKLYFSPRNMVWALAAYLGLMIFYTIFIRHWDRIKSFICRHAYFAAASLIGACTALLYWKYISGKYFYIFYGDDIGSDSYVQTYPYLIHTARRIRLGQWREYFNFTQGLGTQDGSLVADLHNWPAFFGEKNTAYLMGISQWLKTMSAGIFAYFFSRIYGNGHRLSIAAAFGYAFNAFIIIRGAWDSYPNLALLLIIWMTAYEYAHKKNRGYFLPIATVVFFYSIDIYDCLFWGAALSAYIVFREYLKADQMSGTFLSRLCRMETQYWCFALLGMADTVIKNLAKTLQSHRFSQSADSFAEIIKDNLFADAKEISSAFLRTMGMAIEGISEYQGYDNFLEAPAFYCSILIFILIPLSVYHMGRREKRIYCFGYAAAGLYIFLRPVRFIMNGLSGFTYKLSSLWIVAFMFLTVLFFFPYAFSEHMEFKEKSTAVFNITIAAVMISMAVCLGLGHVVRFDQWLFSFGCTACYGILINLMLFNKISRKLTADILCACVIVEVLFTAWDCINDRTVVSRADKEAGMLYDHTAALDGLKHADSGWYRIEKRDGTVSLCESLAQNYQGTMSYVGGTGIGNGILDFYFGLELPHEGDHYLMGSGGDIYTGALLGIKYYFKSSGQEPYIYGLSRVMTVDDVDIYKNTYALPLAYAYDRVIPYEVFSQLSGTDKRKIMLEGCVTEDDSLPFLDIKDTSVKKARRMNKYKPVQKNGRYELDLPAGSILVIRLKTDSDELWNLCYENQDHMVYAPYYCFEPGEENTIEIYADDLKAVWFSSPGIIEKAEFYYQDADAFYASMTQAVDKMKANALQLTGFSESGMEGQIECSREMILATSIPYDEKWQIFVDGNPVDTMKVNIGFVGAKLASGRHKVILRYDSSSWIFDHKFQCIGFPAAVCIAAYGIYKRKRKLNKNINSN